MTDGAPRVDRARVALVFALPFLWRLLIVGWLLARGAEVKTLMESGDVPAFLSMAHAMLDWSRIPEFALGGDSRAFPLWPLAMAGLLKLGMGGWAWIFVAPLLAGLASVVLYRASGSLSAGLLLGVAPPAWVLATLLPMSESFYLCLGLLAALALQRDRCLLAGLLLGAMVATRPFGIAWVLAASVVVLSANGDRAMRLGALGLGTLLGVLPLVVVNILMFGDLFHQIRVYSGSLVRINLPPEIAARLGDASGHWGFPFKNLIMTPWHVRVPLWKIVYIYAHVALLLGLAPFIWRRFRQTCAAISTENFLALSFIANGLLAASTGPYWGFHSFDRYLSWAAPGAILAVRGLVPERRWPWLAGAAGLVSLASVVFATSR